MPRLQQGVEIHLRISGAHVETAPKKAKQMVCTNFFSLCTAKSHLVKSVVFN